MNARIVVLGAGLVGRAIAIDLKKTGHDVTSVDLNSNVLDNLKEQYGIETKDADFSDIKILKELIKDADLVVGAAPGALGFRIMKGVIEAGKNMVDISFCPEDYLELNDLAIEMGVTVVADMGVAPGMCNTILGYHNAQMEVDSYKCIVGGLPFRREWPLEYKSSWSPIDCIEEYIRPARFMRNGRVEVKPALSEAELVHFNEVGTLEEWNSDGLRSLLATMPHIPNMVEKTLRYPGTIEYLKAHRELGYFSYEEMEVNGKMIRPIDLTAKLLFPKWKLEKRESEFTIMRINIEGSKGGKTESIQYDLFDVYDKETDTLSMSRTTGYACTGVAGLILKGKLNRKGVLPPERVAEEEENFELLMHHFSDRSISYRRSDINLNSK